MLPIVRQCITLLTVVALVLLFWQEPVRAQRPRRQTRLTALQLQNAVQQQQNAVQGAVQLTTALVQSAYHRQGLTPQQGGALQLVGTPVQYTFQQQVYALQTAIQQTSALLQVNFRQNSALSATALRQLNTLQTALQQTIAIQGLLATQNGQFTAVQLQMLSQEQASLLGLLTSPPAPLPSGTSRR